MIQKLQKIGLTDKEANTYRLLVKLGESTIGPLERGLNLHKQIVYNTLDRLANKGLVKSTKHNGRNYFSITDPSILAEQNLQEKRIIDELVPQIHAQLGEQKAINETNNYSGIAAFQVFHYKRLKQAANGSAVQVIGAGGDEFLKIVRQKYFFDRYENLRIHKKISHQLLMYENQRNVDKEYIDRRYIEARFLPESYHQPIATQVWPDRVAILFFDNEPQIVEIKSTKITEGFRNYFKVLWKLGKK